MALTSTQRKYLRGLAHGLEPLAHLGKHGLSEAFLLSLDQALGDHELVKVRFVDHKDRKAELCREIEDRLDCALAGRIGHVAILYRQARDPDRRRIRLPK